MPPLDARTLRAGGLFTLTTRFGDFDLLADPDPGLDDEMLSERAFAATVHGVPLRVASLDDLIAMKRAAGRPKDRAELETQGALRRSSTGGPEAPSLSVLVDRARPRPSERPRSCRRPSVLL